MKPELGSKTNLRTRVCVGKKRDLGCQDEGVGHMEVIRRAMNEFRS